MTWPPKSVVKTKWVNAHTVLLTVPGIGKSSRSRVDLIGVKHTAELERKKPLTLPPPCCSRKDLTMQFCIQRQYFQTVPWMPEFAVMLLSCYARGWEQGHGDSGVQGPHSILLKLGQLCVHLFMHLKHCIWKEVPSASVSWKEIQGTGGRVLSLGSCSLQPGKHGDHKKRWPRAHLQECSSNSSTKRRLGASGEWAPGLCDAEAAFYCLHRCPQASLEHHGRHVPCRPARGPGIRRHWFPATLKWQRKTPGRNSIREGPQVNRSLIN